MRIAPRLTADKVAFRLAFIATFALSPPLLHAQAQTAAPAPAPGPGTAASVHASTLDRVRSTGRLTFGFFPEARPLSYRNPAGVADGYAVALCRGIAAIVKIELKRPDLAVRFVPVDSDPIGAVSEGRIDILCAPVQPRLSLRAANIGFSIPIFAGGTGVLMRKDAPTDFRELLEGRATGNQPLWRGQPQLQILQQRKFVVVAGTTSERWVMARKHELGVSSAISTVPDLKSGLQKVRDGKADALLADRSVLLGLTSQDPSNQDVTVGGRAFDHTTLSLAYQGSDHDLGLIIDKTLSRLYRTGRIGGIYEKHLGKPNAATSDWFRQVAQPE
ncbi:MAG: transporter substrate-binding domain-containing protein [Pseudoxanthomonas sp.]